MATTSQLAALPLPERSDRVDAPGSFAAFAQKAEEMLVLPFASSVARGTAYTNAGRTPLEGTLSYLRDVNAFEYFDGATWTPITNDTYPQGILQRVFSSANFPIGAGNYVPQNTEQFITDFKITHTLIAGRVYRIAAWFACLDGAPGSSMTTKGGQLRIRYNNSTTTPTTASLSLVTSNFSAITDDSQSSSGATIQRVWTCPATSAYTFSVSMFSYSTVGVRALFERDFYIEDLGRGKA